MFKLITNSSGSQEIYVLTNELNKKLFSYWFKPKIYKYILKQDTQFIRWDGICTANSVNFFPGDQITWVYPKENLVLCQSIQ